MDLSGCRQLVDLGCGSGLYSITLCRHHLELSATLVDREQVLPTTEALIASSGLADRIRTRDGGTVVIRGYYPEPGDSESPFDAILRLNLLLFDPDRLPPSRADVECWLGAVGFRDVRAFALTERSTCITGKR